MDPILISAKLIDGLQTMISHEAKLVDESAVITVEKITAGTPFNVIPESAEMIGSVRTLDTDLREMIIRRMKEMAPALAKAYGGDAEVEFQNNTAITYNDLEWATEMLPTLQNLAGEDKIELVKAITGIEDFF